MGSLKPHSTGQLYSNSVSGTLAVDGWAVTVTFGTARRAWAGPARKVLGGTLPGPSSLYQM